jgi:hypothetical protein
MSDIGIPPKLAVESLDAGVAKILKLANSPIGNHGTICDGDLPT